jgi:catechol 2,3-dioxygenase-like lactoylglutathione lyase family enzyme
MPLVSLDHVQLAMPPNGEEQARGFYRDILGLAEVAKPAELKDRGGCWFERDGMKIHLGVEQEFRPALKAHPAFLVADFPEMVARLRDAGCEVRPAELAGLRRLFTSDPFGNRIELIETGNPNQRSA